MKENEEADKAAQEALDLAPYYAAKLLGVNASESQDEIWGCILLPEVKANREISLSNLSDLALLMDAALHERLDRELLAKFVRMKLRSLSSQDSEIEELERLQIGIRNLYDLVTEAIIAAKEFSWVKDELVRLDTNQAKYKISTAAQILKVERATLNNWTNSKGGFIRSFQPEGASKFIFESDLQAKYKEITGRELVIDDQFRKAYKPYTPS